MRKFLLASHAYFAEGIYSSLKMIIGEQNNVSTICAYTTENYDLKKELMPFIEALQSDDELIIITDIFGGSVNNECMNIVGEADKKIYLIAGLNLPLLIELISKQFDEDNMYNIIEHALESSKGIIQFCNKVLETSKIIKDDEF